MRILVTGGGGFLGKAIVEQLAKRGDQVRSFARGSYPELEKIGVEVHRGDLANKESVLAAAKGCDAIIHVGAKAGVWGTYDEYYQANVVGTENVIAACRAHDIPKLVYTSSPSVVDNGESIEGADESIPYPEKYTLAYPETKGIAEKMIMQIKDFATVSIRPPLIWGPGDTNLTPRILARAKAGRMVKIGSHPAILDTTFIDNAAEAHLLALDKLERGSTIDGKVYFISNGEPMPAVDIINGIIGVFGYPPINRTIPKPLAYAAGWTAETLYKTLGKKEEPPLTRFLVEQLSKSRWFNISAARRDLGYNPSVSIKEGLQKLKVSWQNA